MGLAEVPHGLQCSHLCHRHTCCEPSYINLEPSGITNQRETCIYRGEYTGHIDPITAIPFPECFNLPSFHPDSWVRSHYNTHFHWSATQVAAIHQITFSAQLSCTNSCSAQYVDICRMHTSRKRAPSVIQVSFV